jgi:hypothetical protein
MWIRYQIKCQNCQKITNLRLHLISQDKQSIKFDCPNPDCQSKIEGNLLIDYYKFKNYKPKLITRIKALFNKSEGFKGFTKNFHQSLELIMSRGELIRADFDSGDYFLEYSDGLAVGKASETVHNKWTPFLRENFKNMEKIGMINSMRNLYDNEIWNDLIDLINAYNIFNTENIKSISSRIKTKCKLIENISFDFSSNLGFINAYFVILNHLVFPWIDFEKHSDFIEFLFNKLFSPASLENRELEIICSTYTENDFLKKFNHDCSLLITRFIELRDLFKLTYQNVDFKESIISNPNFTEVKSFYTDCFEFLGRYSIIPLKLMNVIERGSIDSMPSGIPRNIFSTIDYDLMNNGNKIEVIEKCTTIEIVELFTERFDSKLRNGINHFKTKFNSNTQIISYYPVTKRPNEEYQISYEDFLLKALNIFESVLRLNQFIKMFHYYNRDKKIYT